MYRILIIEDDFSLAEAMKKQMESWGSAGVTGIVIYRRKKKYQYILNNDRRTMLQ